MQYHYSCQTKLVVQLLLQTYFPEEQLSRAQIRLHNLSSLYAIHIKDINATLVSAKCEPNW